MSRPVVDLTGIVSLTMLEESLVKHYVNSIATKSLHFSLRDTVFISPLTLSLITCWSHDVTEVGGSVTIHMPQRNGLAAAFLNTTAVSTVFERHGWKVLSSPPGIRGLPPRALSAFEAFASADELAIYLDRLSERVQAGTLLHTEDAPAVIRTGDFQSVILKELLDNTFAHAGGVNSHYSVLQIEPETQTHRIKSPRSILSSFDGRSYLEVCVADSSPNNLVDTLKPHISKGYAPAPRFPPNRGRPSLDDAEKCILYAFEYASTSNPGRRREKMAQWFESPSDNAASISTGLYDLAALARAYHGQVIVRTAGHLGTLDFSSGRRDPVVSFVRKLGSVALAKLRGTLIAFRAPLQEAAPARVSRTEPQPAKSRAERVDIVEIAPDFSTKNLDNKSLPQILANLEQQACSALQAKIQDSHRIVVVMLDGMSPESKLLGSFIQALLPVPRSGNALVVLTHDTRALEAKTETGPAVESRSDKAERFPSFLICPWPPEQAWAYGSQDHPDGTALQGTDLVLPKRSLRSSLHHAMQRARVQRLNHVLSQSPVRHAGALFLIESKYYTRVFYEVRRLLDSGMARSTLTMWIAFEIAQQRPDVVLFAQDYMETLLMEALQMAGFYSAISRSSDLNAGRLLKITRANINERRFHINTAAGQDGRVLFVTDVICTGHLVREFLTSLSLPGRVTVLTLVDARLGDLPYFPIQTSTGSTDVKVICAHRASIEPLRERPPAVALRSVVIVDPSTNAPTQYTLPADVIVDDKSMFVRAARCGALAAGHFVLSNNHYLYFFELAPLFREFREEIATWLRNTGIDMHAVPNARDAVILCLDEGTGLVEIVEMVTRAVNLPSPQKIARDALAAPPAQGMLGSTPVLWFVLPVVATGATVQRCLEYATRLNASLIQISTVTSRMAPDSLTFHKNVTRYRGAVVEFREFLSVPILTFGKAECPACNRAFSLEIAHGQLLLRSPRSAEMLREARQALEPLRAGADFLPRSSASSDDDLIWREAYLQSLYQRAIRDVEARQRLKTHLLTMVDAGAFAGMVGRNSHLPMFESETRARVIYGDDPFSSACSQWVREEHVDANAFRWQLRGFLTLAPNTLRGDIRELFRRQLERPANLRSLLVEAALDTNVFWDALDSGFDAVDDDVRSAIHELRDYAKRGGGAIKAILALNELRWHLSRSSGWSLSLQALGLQLRQSPVSSYDVTAALRSFLQDGVDDAERLIAGARRTGRIWPRLSLLLMSPDDGWREVQRAVERLRAMLESLLPGNLDERTIFKMSEAIAEIETATSQFVEIVDTIATRPEAIIEQARLKYPAFEIDVNVADDFPAIAMVAQDFLQLVLALLENAHDVRAMREADAASGVTFDFVMDEDPYWVVLRVSDDHKWTTSVGLEGGLVRIRELCSFYDAIVRVPNALGHGDKGNTECDRFQIRFRAWTFGD